MSSSHHRTPAGPFEEGQSTKQVSKSGPRPSQVPNFAVIIGQEAINGVWHYLWVAKWPFSADQTVQSCPYTMIPYQYRDMLGTQKLRSWNNIKAYYESAVIVPFLPSHIEAIDLTKPRKDEDYDDIPNPASPQVGRNKQPRDFVLVIGTMQVVDRFRNTSSTSVLWTPTLATWSAEEYCVNYHVLLELIPAVYHDSFKLDLKSCASTGLSNLCKWKVYFQTPMAVPLCGSNLCCEPCNEIFTRAADLKRHINTSKGHQGHSKEEVDKPFMCIKNCKSAFARNDHLTQHRNICKIWEKASAAEQAAHLKGLSRR